MKIKNNEIKNILCLRNDRFGEFLLNIPALRALKETFPNARLIMAADPYLTDLIKAIPMIDEVIEWGQVKHSWGERLKLISCLRKKRIDMAVMLNPSKEFNIITFWAGIPIRVGYDRKCAFLLTHRLKDLKYLGKKHEIEYNLELVERVGAKTRDLSTCLSLEGDISGFSLDKHGVTNSDILVALHPWTSDPVKQWPLSYFEAVANELLSLPGVKIIIIGGHQEAAKSRQFCEKIPHRENLIDLTGKTSLRESGALLKKCRLVISGDSGPAHLAVAVGIRVLAIFRNDIPDKGPGRWGPRGQGHAVIERANLADITPAEVVSKAKEMLNI